MTLNKKRRESLIGYCYELSKLLVAGLGLAGILQPDPSWLIIGWGFALAVVFFLVAFYLEGDGP